MDSHIIHKIKWLFRDRDRLIWIPGFLCDIFDHKSTKKQERKEGLVNLKMNLEVIFFKELQVIFIKIS